MKAEAASSRQSIPGLQSDRVRRWVRPRAVIAVAILAVATVAAFRIGLAVVFMGGLVALLLMQRHPLAALCVLLVVTPFSSTALLDSQLGGITGLKIPIILALLTILANVLSPAQAKGSRTENVLAFGMFFFLSVSVIRSLPHLAVFNWFWNDSMDPLRFLLSHLVKPALYFVPFVLVVRYVRERKDFVLLLDALQCGVVALSLLLLGIYLFSVPDKSNFEIVRGIFGEALGMHGNDLALFYIVLYPVALARLIDRRSFLGWATVLLSIATVLVLYSRAAYVVLLLESAMVLLSQRGRRLLPLLVLLGIVLSLVLPSSVAQRATTGLNSGDANVISAGRVQDIWLPLIKEYLHDPFRLVFGAGRYAILFSESAKSNLVLEVGHAHNMYLDIILDAGLVGLAFFLVSFLGILRTFAAKVGSCPDTHLRSSLYGIFVSLIGYMVSGFSGRSFMPTLDNGYLWVLLAVGLGIVRNFTGDAPAAGRLSVASRAPAWNAPGEGRL